MITPSQGVACVEIETQDGHTRARVSVDPGRGYAYTPRSLTWLRVTETPDASFCAEGCSPTREPWTSPWYDAPDEGRFAVRFRYWTEHDGDVDRRRVAVGRSDVVHLANNCDESDAGQICVQLDGRHVANNLLLINTTTGTPVSGEWINPHFVGISSRTAGLDRTKGRALCQPGHCPRGSEPFTLTEKTRVLASRWDSHAGLVRYRWSATREVRRLEAVYEVPR